MEVVEGKVVDEEEARPAPVTEGGRGSGAPKMDCGCDEDELGLDPPPTSASPAWKSGPPLVTEPGGPPPLTSPCSVAPEPGTPPNISRPGAPDALTPLFPGVPLPP